MPKSVPYTSTQPISQSKLFFSSRRRHTSCGRDWSSDVCSSDLLLAGPPQDQVGLGEHRGDALTHREGIRVDVVGHQIHQKVLGYLALELEQGLAATDVEAGVVIRGVIAGIDHGSTMPALQGELLTAAGD